MKSEGRRNFLKLATLGVAAGIIAKPESTKLTAPVSIDDFLNTSELISQRDLLIDSIIRRNPNHALLSHEELQRLISETRESVAELFRELAQNELTSQDRAEIVEHLKRPVDQKWADFHKKVISHARGSIVERINATLDKKNRTES